MWNEHCIGDDPLLIVDVHDFVCNQDNIGEIDSDRQEELRIARRQAEENEEKGRKNALLFDSEDTFDSIASLEEKVFIDSLIIITIVLNTFSWSYFLGAFFFSSGLP